MISKSELSDLYVDPRVDVGIIWGSLKLGV